MHLTEAVSIATSNPWAHKLRSVLMLIGVVIGVTSVIAVVSLNNSITRWSSARSSASSSAYSAWKAARLDAVEALRYD